MQRIAESALVAEELSRIAFERLEAEWDDLADRAGRREPFYRHYFLRAWLDNFAPEARVRVFVARDGARLIAALPLIEEQTAIYGLPVRQLASASNAHSARFDLLLERGREDAVRALWAHLRSTAEFDLLLLRDVPPEGAARGLVSLAQQDGCPVYLWESQQSPYLSLEGGFGAVEAGLAAHFCANLRRRRRKMERKGPITYERAAGGPQLERLVEEGLALEALGWKGRAGTAVRQRPGEHGFYREVAHRAALRGELALHFLRLAGRPVAYQFGLVAGATAFLPKTSYDEGHGECSPGQLLMVEVLRDACARGLREFDFLGLNMPWKREWAGRTRAHHWLYVFGASARARLLHRMKSSWVPRAREALRWRP